MDMDIVKNEEHWLEIRIGLDKAVLEWLVEKLNADKGVEFAAYRKDHPLVGMPHLIVKTKSKDASEVLVEKLEEATQEVQRFSKEFQTILKEK